MFRLSFILTLFTLFIVPLALFLLLTQRIELSMPVTLLLIAAVSLRIGFGLVSLLKEPGRNKRTRYARRR
ncbi:hypothetical protein [Alteromonas oceanisediminis]|uniref:hypothetical protein n=1 Tax=Alteromonas oceanisediminis TaxID=2836180 RepID=UPI001BDA4026|nr:hypothetical protein [Alteromonas oceanisediminis]MBT0586913.1 hypothetical protein [Alteromonas oceanisediminis]